MKKAIDTMTYWPKKIETSEDIPSDLQTMQKISRGQSYSILFPPLPYQFIREKNKILTLEDKGLEYTEQRLSTFLDFNEISSIEWTTSLLKGLLKIYHNKRIFQISFNSSRNDLILPFIESYREKKAVLFSEQHHQFCHCSKLEFLIKSNLKFFNIAGDTINNSDTIEKFFFQEQFFCSDIQMSFRAKYYSPSLVLRLENEWIIIKEDKQKITKSGTYGWVRQYIHKEMVKEIYIITDSSPNYLIFDLKGSYDFRIPVSADNTLKAEVLLG